MDEAVSELLHCQPVIFHIYMSDIWKFFLSKRYFLEDIFVFLWFLVLTFYFTQQREFPYIFSDEYGVLGAAAALAGYKWSTPVDMPFYGFGLSLFIAPLYKLAFDPGMLYRTALSINGLLIAISAVLALRTIRTFSTSQSGLLQVCVVVAAFSYPAVSFYAGMAMGETILLFCLMLIIYSLVALIGQQDSKYLVPIFLGLGLGLAPYAHARGLVFWLAIMPVCWFALKSKWFTPKQIGIALLFAMLITGILAAIKNWLIVNFYSEVLSGTGSAKDFIASKLELLASDQLFELALVAFGQFAYIMTSSFGLAFVGLVAILATISPFHMNGNQEGEISDNIKMQKLAATFVGLACVLMFFISMIQLSAPERSDHFFYGRYNEVMMPSLIIAALIFLTIFGRRQKNLQLAWLSGGLLLAALLMLGVQQFPAEIFERRIYWNPISSWFVHIQETWKIQPMLIFTGTVIAGIILVVVLLLSHNLFLLTLAAMFTAAVSKNYGDQHYGSERVWTGYGKLGAIYGAALSGRDVGVVGDQWMGPLSGEAMQFAFPHSHINFDGQAADKADVILDLTSKYCNTKNTIGHIGKAEVCVLDELLLAELDKLYPRMEAMLSPRMRPPARIEIGQARIEIDREKARLCALASKFFYSSWGRYCLPLLEIHVGRKNLQTNERQQRLGLFITDEKNNWLSDWRVELDTAELAHNGQYLFQVPIYINASMTTGEYKLYAVMVDNDGWDWRTKESISIILN